MRDAGYRGRFAPSPTGPLHLGSLVAALASWLDARAHGGRWLVRIEDIDPPREQAGAARAQLEALTALGLTPDQPPTYQSAHSKRFEQAVAALQTAGQLYRCTCSRSAVEQAALLLAGRPDVYPGTCRDLQRTALRAALRVRVPADRVGFVDRACGEFWQALKSEVGDFVVLRADGLWAYQLAVVVDDGAQQITDVVRGADLLDNTPRQIHLQRLLGLPTPRYLHVPMVLNEAGEKLSKQTGAAPLELADPVGQLEQAWRWLGFAATGAATVSEFLTHALRAWQERWVASPDRVDTMRPESPSTLQPGVLIGSNERQQ
ncbi:MAG TPA: tRNA glutamyl-Q(34) synthetase GluQRS [Burkholderiaceae bacterium]|nr:tRNA glutamyl-Q(34) synthetase GluQRS [Burkholderiaceae bacterium]